MKRIIFLFAAVVLTANIFAQAPQAMSYQAVIRNSSNALVTNSKINMQISILQGSTTGSAVYVETQSPTTNANGLISIKVGQGTVVSGNFSGIDWSLGIYYIKTESEIVAGTGYTIIGTSQLLSVPYALYAQKAGSGTHYIGERYGGGIVFYVYDDGQHGLIADTVDLGDLIWANGNSVTNAVRNGIGAGKFNTERIIINQGAGSYAAQVCANYNNGNYGDWYLPSTYELNLLYLQKSVVGGFADDIYWSSTEGNSGGAGAQGFDDGIQYINEAKLFTARVRAIRAF